MDKTASSSCKTLKKKEFIFIKLSDLHQFCDRRFEYLFKLCEILEIYHSFIYIFKKLNSKNYNPIIS